MKKIGLLCLALVLALGSLGAGFAYWTETLDIGQNQVDTGKLDATFCNGLMVPGSGLTGAGVVSNDDGVNDVYMWIDGPLLNPGYLGPVVPDPDDDGGDPTAPQTIGQNVDRTDDVALTTVSGSNTQLMTVTMTNAYPSYSPTVFFTIRNWGTIPARVKSISLVMVSGEGGVYPLMRVPLLVPCNWYDVSIHDGRATVTRRIGEEAPECTDFSIHLSDDAPSLGGKSLYDIMEAGGHGHYSAVSGDLSIHVEDCAEELTTYDFTVQIEVVPFNA